MPPWQRHATPRTPLPTLVMLAPIMSHRWSDGSTARSCYQCVISVGTVMARNIARVTPPKMRS